MEILAWKATDIDEMVQIEQRSFSDAWTQQMFSDCFAYPVYQGFVAKEGGQVCGYGCMMVLFEEAEIANIAVDAPYRGRGVGKRLLQQMHAFAKQKGAEVCLLEVRRSNAAAIALYRGFGYAVYGERKGYYPDGEDALLMRATL